MLIKLSNHNSFFEIDNEDFDLIKDCKWRLNKKTGYIDGYSSVFKKRIYLHRLIMNLISSKQPIDHIDRNKLNNTKNNLRFCTDSQNSSNISIRKNNTSGYKGVIWEKRYKKWQAQIYKNKIIYIGLFEEKIEAARAYDKKAKELFGEFAWLNFGENNGNSL